MPRSPIRSLARFLKNSLYLRSFKWAKTVQNYPLGISRASGRDLSRGVYIPEIDTHLTGDPRYDLILLENLTSPHRLYVNKKAMFEFDGDGWRVRFDDLAFHVTAEQQIWILCEVFLREDYCFNSDPPPDLVIDIGMNFGAASIYFAKKYGCPVHAFELFPPTANHAARTLALNPKYASQIQINRFGLSDADEQLTLDYCEAFSGEAGIFADKKRADSLPVAVEVRRASDALRPVLDSSSGSIFVKMDCEGSEFSILSDLENSGLLSKINGLAMEWHSFAGNPETLEATLIRAGFSVFNRHEDNGELGLIMASRVRKGTNS